MSYEEIKEGQKLKLVICEKHRWGPDHEYVHDAEVIEKTGHMVRVRIFNKDGETVGQKVVFPRNLRSA